MSLRDEDFIVMKIKKSPKINASLATKFLERFDMRVHPQTIHQNI